MNKDWTKSIRDKVSESELTPPNDMWTAISSDLDAMKHVHKPRRWTKERWWSIAACIAVIVVGAIAIKTFNLGNELSTGNELTAVNQTDNKVKDEKDIADNPVSQKPIETLVGQSAKSTNLIPTHKNIVSSNDLSDNVKQDVNDISSSIENEDNNSAIVETADTISPSIVEQMDNAKVLLAQGDEYAPIFGSNKSRKQVSVSLYACNTNMGSLNGNNGDGDSFDYNFNGSDDSVIEDPEDTFEQSLSRNASEPELVDAQHKQPLRFGMSARFPLFASFSISTGIVYSRLASTMTWTGNTKSYETEQVLHYIGIPVSIDYNLTSYKCISFYLSAGAMIEKCVYGTSKISYSPVSNRVSESRLQMSLFGGPGLQFNITDFVSIYAEPMATYYFNNHSEVVNIYKDRPWNFDLRLGLRLMLK